MPKEFDCLNMVVMADRIPTHLGADEILRKCADVDVRGFQRGANHQSAANGVCGDFAVVLNISQQRIDWVVQRRSDPPAMTEGAPLIVPPSLQGLKDYRPALAMLLPQVKEYAESCMAQRIAIVLNESEVVPDEATAMARLKDIVPGLPAAEGANEINFQINVRRPTKANPKVQINRNGRWFIGQKQMILIQLALNSGIPVPPPVGPERNQTIVGSHLDINTAPEARLEQGDAGPIFDEMVDALETLVTDGYNGIV